MSSAVLFKRRNTGITCCWVLSIVLVIAILVTCCSKVEDGMIHGGRNIEAVINRAESIMDDDAATADSLMQLIDSQSIRGKERQARYALIYTAAHYKNYQPMTTDSLIMIAVRHYSISKNLDYRFLSYYYLGCVYVELGQYTDAAVALSQAEQLVYRIDNDYWKGLLYTQLGVIFDVACDYNRAVDYHTKAEACYKRAEKKLHRAYAQYKIGHFRMNLQDYIIADSIFRLVEEKATELDDMDLYTRCLYDRLLCTVYMKQPDSATIVCNEYLKVYKDSSNDVGHLKALALYYNLVKDYSKSELCLDEAWKCDLSITDSTYLYFVKSLLAESKGLKDESLDYYHEYISLQNADLRATMRQPLLAAQNEQYRIMAENELLKNHQARMMLMLCVIIFLLILVIVMVTYYYKKKNIQEQLYDSLGVVEELTAQNLMHTNTIEQLRNQVRIQFHERYDITNRLYSMYFDSASQEKITKQQLKVTINSLIKDYTSTENVRRLDSLLNESYDGIMDRMTTQEMGLTDKEVQLFRYSFAGLSSKSVSVIIKETPQNIYQIKSRLLKKVRRNSEELWSKLCTIW